MANFPWVYLVRTSRRTEYHLCLVATILTGCLTAWVALLAGGNAGTGALVGISLVLAGATAYARRAWMSELTHANRPLAVLVRARP